MKSVYKMIFDNGKIFYIRAKSRTKAIEQYCKEYGISEEWVKEHCRIVNQGMCDIAENIENCEDCGFCSYGKRRGDGNV